MDYALTGTAPKLEIRVKIPLNSFAKSFTQLTMLPNFDPAETHNLRCALARALLNSNLGRPLLLCRSLLHCLQFGFRESGGEPRF